MPLVRLVERYHKWEPALFSLVLFTLSIGWGAISTPLMNTLNAIGQINTSLKLMIFWTVLTWVLTPICIWFVGFQGVALAAFIISFTSIWPMMIISKLLPVHIWEQIWRQLLAVAVMAVVAWLGLSQWSQSFSMLGVGLVLGGLTYLTVLAIVGWGKIWNEVRQLGIFRL